MERHELEEHIRLMPEPKLQLIAGRLVVGNVRSGNMQLLRDLLVGWGAEAAVDMAPLERWRVALHHGFRPFDPPAPDKPLSTWKAWAAQLGYVLDIPPAGPMVDGKHRATRQSLLYGLFRLARGGELGYSSGGGDVVMRLGDDSLTPDVFALSWPNAARLNDNYADGPADLVIEVVPPGDATQDRVLKRGICARERVPEYWLVDPYRQEIEFLRLASGAYERVLAPSNGIYCPHAFPMLRFREDVLWREYEDPWREGGNPFTIEGTGFEIPTDKTRKSAGVSWGDLEFEPAPDVESTALSFDQFISWCPEAKFERIDSRPWVGGSRGSRNVIGMLLRTEGLAESVKVLHPSAWIAALLHVEQERADDAARRAHWWQIAREAAALLREKFRFRKLAVIGDLARPQPLRFWSEITIVVSDPRTKGLPFDVYDALHHRFQDETRINIVEAQHATGAEERQIAAAAIEI